MESRDENDTTLETCLTLTQSSELESNDGTNESVAMDVTNSNVVVCEKNPLGNYLILRKVLSYQPTNSLLNYRLVNQFWNARALPLIQQKINGRYCGVKPSDFSKLCADFEYAKKFPLTKLQLTLSKMSLRTCSTFFRKHGSWIQDIHLHEDTARGYQPDEHYLQETRTKLEHIFRHVPNLKKLAIDMHYIPQAFPDQFILDEQGQKNVTLTHVNCLDLSWQEVPLSKHFLDAFFKMLPNVREFHNTSSYNMHTNPNQDWKVFVEVLKNAGVHTFHGRYNAKPEGLWRAMTGCLTLKALTMDLVLNDVPLQPEVLEHFLRSQAGTLEYLKLSSISHSSLLNQSNSIGLPVMKNLRTLWFSSRPPIKYLQSEQFPKLQTVHADPGVFLSRVFGDAVFSSVEEYFLTNGLYSEEVRVLPQIAKIFPNLKKLTGLVFRMNVKTMNALCTHLTNIEDLDLKMLILKRPSPHDDSKNINLVLSGIPDGNEQWALDQLAQRVGYAALPSSFNPEGAALLNLTRLRRLTLKVTSFSRCLEDYGEKPPANIDEIGCYFTFLRLSAQLQLTLQGDFTISDDLARKLGEHFRIIYLKPNRD